MNILNTSIKFGYHINSQGRYSKNIRIINVIKSVLINAYFHYFLATPSVDFFFFNTGNVLIYLLAADWLCGTRAAHFL